MKDAKEMTKKGEVWGTSDATGKKKKYANWISGSDYINWCDVNIIKQNSYKTTHTVITHFFIKCQKTKIMLFSSATTTYKCTSAFAGNGCKQKLFWKESILKLSMCNVTHLGRWFSTKVWDSKMGCSFDNCLIQLQTAEKRC